MIARKMMAAILLLWFCTSVVAGPSTVNPSIPASGALLQSAPLRANFAAAENDINALISQNGGTTAPSSPVLGQQWLNTSSTPYVLNEWDGAAWIAIANLNASTHTWTTLGGALLGANNLSDVSSASTALANLGGTQSINKVWASPASGGIGPMAVRSLVAADLPAAVAYTNGSQTFSGTQTFINSLVSTVATGTAPFTVASTTPVANLSIGGNAATATLAATATTAVAAATATSSTSSTNLAGGSAGSLPYQSAAGATSFLAPGTNGYILSSSSGLPAWSSLASLFSYPGTGIPNSIGTGWGTSYSTSGSGSVCLTTNCAMTTPNLGTPSAIVLTNATGTAASLTAGTATVANGLKSATTTVTVSSATAPASGQVLTAISSTSASWQSPAAGVTNGYINGFTLSNDSTTPNSILDVAVGYAADSANVVTITGTAFKKSTTGVWASGTGSNGMGTGLTIAASTWYHVFAIINSGSFDVYFDTSATAANAPAGTTAHRYIGSFLTNSSANILTFQQAGQYFYWSAEVVALSSGGATTPTLFTVDSPTGFSTLPLMLVLCSSNTSAYIWSPFSGSSTPSYYNIGGVSGLTSSMSNLSTNTSGQLYYQAYLGTVNVYVLGYINPHVAPNF